MLISMCLSMRQDLILLVVGAILAAVLVDITNSRCHVYCVTSVAYQRQTSMTRPCVSWTILSVNKW